jgi:aryl-alcohol dehydrogenase-like predicted oxidoreductase
MKQKIILGTVQFGLEYGINNSYGKPSEEKVFEILDTAWENGITILDTAESYGNSIPLIGKFHEQRNFRFSIQSKFRQLDLENIETAVRESLQILQIDCFEVYSYHSFNDYYHNKNGVNSLLELKHKGLIKNIGISVYDNKEFKEVIQDESIDVIQLPYNILDNFNERGILIKEAKARGKKIHTRSVFLQGLFFMNEDQVPSKLAPLLPYIKTIKDHCSNESISIHTLALSYAIFTNEIDKVLIGVDDKNQLIYNFESIVNKVRSFDFINKNIFVKEIALLNPVNWK